MTAPIASKGANPPRTAHQAAKSCRPLGVSCSRSFNAVSLPEVSRIHILAESVAVALYQYSAFAQQHRQIPWLHGYLGRHQAVRGHRSTIWRWRPAEDHPLVLKTGLWGSTSDERPRPALSVNPPDRPVARTCLLGSGLGPRWGRIPTGSHGQQRLATVSRPRRSAASSERSPSSSGDPDCLSHGGSRLCPGFETIPIERRTIRTATEPRTTAAPGGRQARRAASRPGKARTGFPAGPGSPGRSSVGGRPRSGRGATCPPAPSG